MREISTVRSQSQVSREMRETWQVCCLASSAPIKNMTGAKKKFEYRNLDHANLGETSHHKANIGLLHTANSCTKVEASSFRCSSDISGVKFTCNSRHV